MGGGPQMRLAGCGRIAAKTYRGPAGGFHGPAEHHVDQRTSSFGGPPVAGAGPTLGQRRVRARVHRGPGEAYELAVLPVNFYPLTTPADGSPVTGRCEGVVAPCEAVFSLIESVVSTAVLLDRGTRPQAASGRRTRCRRCSTRLTRRAARSGRTASTARPPRAPPSAAAGHPASCSGRGTTASASASCRTLHDDGTDYMYMYRILLGPLPAATEGR